MKARFRQSKLQHRLFQRYGRYMAVALVVGGIGAAVVQFSSASTIATAFESESGSLSGPAAKLTDATASNGFAVAFGAVGAPTDIKALTGGDSIALVWDMPRFGIKSVEVYRNDIKVTTITPGAGVVRGDTNGTRYIDKNVSRGSSYQYKVRYISTSNSVSPFSSVVTATHPTNTTPVPTVTVDATAAPDLADYLNTYAKAEIQTWYPKISDAIAYPAYTPPNAIKIVTDESSPYIASATGTTITVKPSWLRDSFNDGGGAFVHEATHVLQSYPNGADTTNWATEGIADWTRDWFSSERFYLPKPNEQLASYSPGGLVAGWVDATYTPGFVRKLNVALHNRTFNANFVASQANGKSAEQLFAEAKQASYGSMGAITNGSGKCLTIIGNSATVATSIQLAPCNGVPGQQWTTIYHDAGLHGSTKKILHFANSAVAPDGRCVDVYGKAIANNSPVSTYNCVWDYNEQWVKQADGSLYSPYSGKCLGTDNDSSGDGAQVVIAICNGNATQRWNVPS